MTPTAHDEAKSQDKVTGVTVTIGIDDRPWHEKWWFVMDDLRRVERMYDGDLGLPQGMTPNTNHVRAIVTRFCGDCWDMRDWIDHDIADAPKSARDAVRKWVDNPKTKARSIRIVGASPTRTSIEGGPSPSGPLPVSRR
jgi:hypothetical protein